MASLTVRAVSKLTVSRLSPRCMNFNLLPRNNLLKVNTPRTFVSSAICLSNRRYSDKHEWIEVNGNVGTIGITNYAQEALGDIVYAQLPAIGEEYKQMDECGALESVKAASELFCPVSGKVVENNEKLVDEPSLINQSCYEKGWLFKLELSAPNEVAELMDNEAYEKFLKEQK